MPSENENISEDILNEIFIEIAEHNWQIVCEKISPLEFADIAEIFNRIDKESREHLAIALGDNFTHEIIPYLSQNVADEILQVLGTKKAAEALSQLDVEDAVQVVEDLSESAKRDILQNIDTQTRIELEQGLAYPEDSAGRMMRKNFASIPIGYNVGQVMKYLLEDKSLPDDFYVIFILDENLQPIGELVLAKIIQNKKDVLIENIMSERIHSHQINDDREEVVYNFRKYGLVEAIVTNEKGSAVGTITVDDVVAVMQEEEEEDFLRAGGISEQDIHETIAETVRMRFPWLFINLLTAIAASFVINLFSDAINSLVLLAILMPIIASMGGNAGIQSATVAVRAIATRRIAKGGGRLLIKKELIIGAISGIILATITSITIYFIYGNISIALIFALATIFTMMVAGISGAGIPLLLEKLKIDPAISSGVFLTMLTDMAGFFLFLGLASLILL